MTIPAVYPKSTRPRAPSRNAPDGLPMFGWVARGAVARSGQPTTEGFRSLVEMGFKTVVSLRAEGIADEVIHPPGFIGLTLLRLPWIDEAAPPANGAIALLDIVSNTDTYPLLIHCRAGRGRTSCAAAIIRHALDGWQWPMIAEEIRLYRLWLRGLVHWPLARVQRAWLMEHLG